MASILSPTLWWRKDLTPFCLEPWSLGQMPTLVILGVGWGWGRGCSQHLSWNRGQNFSRILDWEVESEHLKTFRVSWEESDFILTVNYNIWQNADTCLSELVLSQCGKYSFSRAVVLFSAFLMLRPFNTLPCAVTPAVKLFHCYVITAAVINHNVNNWYTG